MNRIFLLIVLSVPLGGQAQTTTTFVPLQSVWKYLDNGSDQGTAWRAPGFVDAAWAQGPAELGYGDGGEATVVGYGPNASAKYITTYFRKSFTVTGAASYTTANIRVRRDDGVVIYLNGTEIYRNTMPAGTITYTTVATAAMEDTGASLTPTVNAALLVEGSNTLAVEIHQQAGTSSDISFDLEFTATIPGNVPSANAQNVTLNEDTAKAITLTGSDPNGDPLTYTIGTPPAQGALSGTPPAVTYTPNANYSGADSFTFTVSDGTNVSAAATVSLTVTAVNDPPVANSQALTTPEDTALTISVSGSDVESRHGTLADYTQQLFNGSLTGIVDGLSGATWNENTGTLFFVRNVSGGAGTSYEYTADGTLLRTITQSGFEDTEAIAWMFGDTYAIAEENNFQRITICTIAPGATTLDRTAAGNVTWATPVGSLLNLGIESLCYDAGRDLLYYTVEKPAGGAWNIYAMDPDTGVSQILCNVNASIATAGVATDLSDMAFDRATDTILLVSHESSKVIRIDRAGAVLEQRGFTTAFTQAEALALTPDRLRMFIGGEPKQFARYALPANTLTFVVVTPPAHGSLSGLPPRLTYTPAADYYGPDSFTFRVHDGTVPSAAATVSLTVTPANDAPQGSGASLNAEAGEATLIVLPVSDPDGDMLTVQSTAPAHGTLTLDGTTATYTAEAAYTGADQFTYTVSDGVLTAGPFAVNINVLPFNAAPVALDQTATLDEDTPAPVVLTATDAENNPLTWTVLTTPARGTLSGTAPNLTFTPADNYHGADSFTFRVSDGQENSSTATVSLTINPVNDAPVAQAANGNIEAGYPLALTLAATDVDGDALTLAIAVQPVHGTLTGTPPNITYTADTAWSGPDSFTFTASDATLTSTPAAVSIAVAPYNVPPSAQSGSVTTDEDTPAAVTLTATDPESQPLTYAITAAPGQGTLSGTAPNLTYTPFANATGSDSFTWTASDGSKTSAPATCSITINPVNDAPAAQSLTVSTETNMSAPVTLAGTDIEGTPLNFAVATPPAHGTLTGTAPALTYTPVAGYTGEDGFTYKANDGQIDSLPATVTINVSAPVLDTLVAAGSTWKYLDNGSNQGAAWRAPDFNDAAWAQGPAQLGYGDGDEARVISYGPDANNRYVTTYFRREFQLPNPGIITAALKLDLLRDDGAIVYLNGTQVLRSNMPTGTVAWNTLASSNISAPAESTFYSSALSTSLLVPGRNVLAVEVHQGALNSSDLSFDLRLYESQPVITRGPYVQMTGADRATVRWRTDVATTSKLNYGPGAELTSSVSSAALKTEHEITLTGLTPDTRFYYAAGNSGGPLVSGSTYYFTTHPPVGTARPYRFWVLGDPGTGDGNQTAVRNAFYSWNGAQKLDGVLVLGDTVYETGTDFEFQTKFFDMYPTTMRNTTIWPTFGNHDAGSASSATQSGPYYDSFTMPKFGEAGGVASGTEAYYSFDVGNVHFVCLDSEGTSRLTTGNMAAWLEQDLSATTQEWIVAFWHHPPYTKGSRDSDIPTVDGGRMKDMREVFVPILENHGVDLLLFGHEHNYQRSKFIDGHYGVSSTFNTATMVKQTGLGDPAGDGAYVKSAGPHNGAVYTVAGSSGKLNVYTLDHAVSAVNHVELGSFILDVAGRELKGRFLNSTGVIRDTFSIVHNTAPLAAAATVTGNEDSPLSVTLSASDAENDALTYEIVTPPAIGTLTGTAPALTYTPPANYNGSSTLQFRVNDGRVNSATVTVTLEIMPVNDAPLAASQSITAAEDTLPGIILAGTDGDGDTLTFTLTALPSLGTLTGVLPDVTYIPDPNWNGADSFTFTVSDATLTSAPAVISLTITPVNDAPVTAAVIVTTPEDSAASVVLGASDIEGDALAFAIASSPAHGTLSGTAPNLTYTPDADWYGEDSFTFIASDGRENSTGIASISVAPLNDAPLAAAQVVATAEDTAAAITLAGTDPEGDALTFAVTVPPARGTLSGTAPNLTYTPEPNWSGADSFSFTASDAAKSSPAALISLTVTAVNDAPVGASLAVSTAEDTSMPVTLTGTDAEGDALTFTVNGPPVHGTLTGTAPAFTYVPAANYYGPDSFTYLVDDGQADSAAATVDIALSAVNDVPLAAAQILAGTEDIALAITLTGSDPDGDTLSFAVATQPAHGILSGIAPNLTYTPEANWNGTDSFTFIASDGAANSAAASVSITVTPGNTAPLAAAQTVAANEDVSASVILAGSDADGDALTYAVITQPEHGVLSGIAPGLTYTPDPNWYGTDGFTFTVNDGREASAPATVAVNVASVNDTPLASAQSVSLAEDAATALILTGADADGDTMTFMVTAQPLHGTLTGTAPNLTYTPEPNWSGADSFTFAASDATETSPPATIALTVTAVDDAPVAVTQSVATPEDSSVSLTLTGTDTEGAVLTFTIATQPQQGTLSGTPPEVIYTPEADWNGSDSFAFTVSDGTNVSTPAVVNVAVTPVSDPPMAGAQSLSGTEDTAVTLTLAGSDRDGDVLTFTLTALPVHGTLTGVLPALTYFPDANWNGSDSFSFSVSDGATSSPPAVVAFTIAPANDAPAADAIAVTTNEDAAAAVILTASDIEGDALTFSIATPPSHGTVSGTAPNLTYTPEAGWYGEDSFTFIVSDGVENSIPGIASITVTPVSDAPLAVAQSVSTAEDIPLPVILTGTDPDGDPLTFTVTVPPAQGVLSGTPPNMNYTPPANWSGEDSFSFAASDGVVTSAAASVSITVTPVNDAPLATPVNVTTDVSVSVSMTLTGSDVEGSPLTWNITTPAAFGTLSGSGASRTYTPNLAWSGTDQFTFTVSDGEAASTETTATITVSSSGPWQIVARTGHTAPGAGGAAFSVFQPDFVSDAAGRASFRGTAGSITGIWTEGTSGLLPVAVQNAAAPGISGGVFDAVTTGPWAAGDGELLVFGKLLTGTGGVTNSSDLGYWSRSGGVTTLLAREDGTVPEMPAAARFSVLSNVATLEAGDNYAFAATMKTNSSLGITSANDTGLWATFGAPVRLLVRENNAAPGASGGLFDTLTTAGLVSNGAGQLGFSTAMKVAGSITTANRYGLWLWDPAQFGLVARGANAAPGTPAGAVFAQPQNPSFGDGAMVFRSTLTTGTGGVTTSNDTGLWVLQSGAVSLLAREGFQAPGVAAGGLFNGFTEGASMNAGNELAFRTALRNGGGVASANNAGLWVRSRFTFNALALVARKGTAAPGTGTATFASFDYPFLADDGGEAFTATLTSGTGGVTSSNDRGLWLRTATGSITLALREGASFTLAPGDVRTVSNITLPAARSSGRTPLSAEGRLLVLLTFTNGTTALYHYTLP